MLEAYAACRDLFYLPLPPSGQHCVYALQCEDGSLYIGQTADLAARYREHQAGRAADWTRRHKPLRIAYIELAASRQEAMKLEYRLKTGGKGRIRRLVQKDAVRLRQAVGELAEAVEQALPHPEAQAMLGELSAFQAACSVLFP